MVEESRIVTVRVKYNAMLLGRLGEHVEAHEVLYKTNRIGPSLKGTGPLRGLTFAEEKAYLPTIIGVSPTDPKWQESVKDYWANISRDVPFEYINGTDQGGLRLEVGFLYDTAEAAEIGNTEERAEWAKYNAERDKGRFYVMSFEKRFANGQPLNLGDYILYRYCLVYNLVANTPEEIGNSPKIQYYLESDAQKLTAAAEAHQFNVRVMTEYLGLLPDREKVNAVIAIVSDKVLDLETRKNFKYDLRSDTGIDIYLKDYSEIYPTKFLNVVLDKRLKVKAFIHRAIDAGILRVLPNTQVVMYGDDILVGNTMEEACDFLQLDSNKKVAAEIKARLDALK